MKIQLHSRSLQAGSVIVLMTIGMVVLLGVSGLALDMGHGYLMKTRLQNALDAAALSGAKTLLNESSAEARTAALNTFAINVGVGSDMNDTTLIPVVEFSDVLFDPTDIDDPIYVRVSLAGYQQPMWFAQILPSVGNNKQVAASAVAGPSPVLGEICNLLPLMVCGDPASTDHDCGDGSCFGYNYVPGTTDEFSLKIGSGVPSPVGSGNFQLVRFDGDSGGSDIRENLAGSFEKCINIADDVESEPGNTVGPTAVGLNTRFGIYKAPFDKQEHKDTYKPDMVSDTRSDNLPPDLPQYYSDYVDAYAVGITDDANLQGYDHLNGEKYRRIAGVPIVNCTPQVNGQAGLPLLGVACFFLTRPVCKNNGPNDLECTADDSETIFGQIIPGCDLHGTPGPDETAVFGPVTIQLYKDPGSGDS